MILINMHKRTGEKKYFSAKILILIHICLPNYETLNHKNRGLVVNPNFKCTVLLCEVIIITRKSKQNKIVEIYCIKLSFLWLL